MVSHLDTPPYPNLVLLSAVNQSGSSNVSYFFLPTSHFSPPPAPLPSQRVEPDRNRLGRSYNPGRPLGMTERKRILDLYEKGYKISHIARMIGVTHSCVSKIMTRYRQTGSMFPRSYTTRLANQRRDEDPEDGTSSEYSLATSEEPDEPSSEQETVLCQTTTMPLLTRVQQVSKSTREINQNTSYSIERLLGS